MLGTAALLKARDWESGWLTGVFVEKGRALVPMSVEQRREIYLQQTLTTPGAYMKRMFAAGIDQARGVPSQWDDGWDGYVERFASREGQFIAANSLAALGKCEAEIRAAIRPVPVQRLLAEDAACHHAQLSYLQRKRAGVASAVGVVRQDRLAEE